MRIENPTLLARLPALGVEQRRDEQLRNWTSLCIGGTSDILVLLEPQRLPELGACLEAEGIPWRMLGGGTNLLVREGPLPWVVLTLCAERSAVAFHGARVGVSAAADLGRTITECARQGWGGMEGLIGVPGTVGGALRMNAGAYGTEISKFVRSVEVYRAASRRNETWMAEAMGFRYRASGLAAGDILLAAELELIPRPYEEIWAEIKVSNEKRRASQPLQEKSAGCIFKNPPGASAGKLIDELGMKGHRIGGAVVSERHANFFVNRHQATAEDFWALIDRVRNRVQQAFGYELEEEVVRWD